MKTIGLVLHPYDEPRAAGLGRAIYRIAQAIVEQDQNPEHTYIILTKGQKPPPPFAGDNWRVVALPDRIFWLTGYFLRHGRRLDACVFFTPSAPLFFRPQHALVVVHDMGVWVLRAHSLKHRVLQFFQYFVLRGATRVVTVSQSTKDDLQRFLPGAANKATVIHNGFDQISIPSSDVFELPPYPYFLFLGSLKGRKNPLGVLRAFEVFKERTGSQHLLIFAGAYAAEGEVARRVSESPHAADVVMLGYVTDEVRAHLYIHACAFVFPSFFEGFGLPILEAMSVGTPVVTTHQGATAEVAGNAALLVDPHDSHALAEALVDLASDAALCHRYSEAGKRRAAEFSWQRAGAAYLREIKSLLQST